ncbi:MAG: GNAT family N-acetyltransferase [Myxococcales bacterium]
MAFHVRELNRARDRRAIEALDTGFETDSIFELVVRPRGLELAERGLERPMTKRYAIDEVFAPWARWERGWVAETNDGVRGFAAVQHEAWHERLILWFLYIDRDSRRQGLGRALLEHAEAHGRSLGASHLWLETSNVNAPGVRAYERLGYSLCGADARYYGSYMPGESAIYLAKTLG